MPLRFRIARATVFALLAARAPSALAQLRGPSSSQDPYLLPRSPDVRTVALLTVGDRPTETPYRLVGVPDGLGTTGDGDGSFTLFCNHELAASAGIVRAHGATGAFVSRWTIDAATFEVLSGEDLIRRVYLWDAAGAAHVLGSAVRLTRFCSADLPAQAALFNPASGLGTQNQIFTNGEENGTLGRVFAHVTSGPDAGSSYEMPWLGRQNWENAVASPLAQDKTIVIGMDDASPGQLYVYVGMKRASGSDVQRAGLVGGDTYGVAVRGTPRDAAGRSVEDNALGIGGAVRPFALFSLGNLAGRNNAWIEEKSDRNGVTRFLRPEDGTWDPQRPSDFYFCTTNSFSGNSRLYRLHFADILWPEKGGEIEVLLGGGEGQHMMDNLCADGRGHLLIQEDTGNNAHLSAIWQYDIAADALTRIAEFDPARFISGGAGYLTQDEESSGIISAADVIGPGWFLLTAQAHYGIPGELVEGGQLLALFNPASAE